MRWGQEKQSSCFFQAKTAGTTLRRNLCFNLPRAGFNFVRAAAYARLCLSVQAGAPGSGACLRVFCLIAKIGVVRTMGSVAAMRSTRISSSTRAGATTALFERLCRCVTVLTERRFVAVRHRTTDRCERYSPSSI